jgi:hypothetical protein
MNLIIPFIITGEAMMVKVMETMVGADMRDGGGISCSGPC